MFFRLGEHFLQGLSEADVTEVLERAKGQILGSLLPPQIALQTEDPLPSPLPDLQASQSGAAASSSDSEGDENEVLWCSKKSV